MDRPHAFRGASGRVYTFDGPLPREGNTHGAGVALFAAPQAQGWRVIYLLEICGPAAPVHLMRARAAAYALGGESLFFLPITDPAARQAALSDLEAGFQPLCPGQGQRPGPSSAGRARLAA